MYQVAQNPIIKMIKPNIAYMDVLIIYIKMMLINDVSTPAQTHIIKIIHYFFVFQPVQVNIIRMILLNNVS